MVSFPCAIVIWFELTVVVERFRQGRKEGKTSGSKQRGKAGAELRFRVIGRQL